MTELFVSSEQMRDAKNYAQWTFQQFKPYIKGRCLEVGCGVGTFTVIIAKSENCETLYAIDISKDSINYINNKSLSLKIKTECIDLIDMQGNYDFIVCMNVMEHVENDIVFLNKLFSLLSDKGVLFLLVPAHQKLFCNFDISGGHFRRYSKKSLNAFVLPTNIRLLSQYYFNIFGAIGYWLVYKIMKKEPLINPKGELSFFDKLVVPISRFFLPVKVPFGISLISIFTKEN